MTALTGVLIAGCSPHGTSTEAQGGLSHDSDKTTDTGSTAREAPTQNHPDRIVEFADWVPERGPTDRHAPGFELFNLCDEAPDEVWEKAGLHFHPELSETREYGSFNVCSFGRSADKDESHHRGGAGSITVTVDNHSKTDIEERGELIHMPLESVLPDVHFRELIHSNECTAGIETVEGRIDIGDHGKFRGLSMQESCALALNYLEKIVLK